MERPSFDEFVAFLREWGRVSRKKIISPETQFEADLGITGDDGCELLEATEKRFQVRLSSDERGCRDTFGLGFNEFLFHSEGLRFGPPPLITLFGTTHEKVRPLTVGELHRAVCRGDLLKHPLQDG
jgi:hypothetical protein